MVDCGRKKKGFCGKFLPKVKRGGVARLVGGGKKGNQAERKKKF